LERIAAQPPRFPAVGCSGVFGGLFIVRDWPRIYGTSLSAFDPDLSQSKITAASPSVAGRVGCKFSPTQNCHFAR
jgi:hypothetical protein